MAVGTYIYQKQVNADAVAEQEKALVLQQEEMKAAQRDAEAKLQMAEDARRMAEEKAQQEAQARAQLVAELNERLKQEAGQRERAEAALDKLEAERAALEEAQIVLLARIDELDKASAIAATEEGKAQKAALAAEFEAQSERMKALQAENERIRQEYEAALERQLKTAEAIVQAGGTPVLENPSIRSTNVRRRDAIYLKERNLGTYSPIKEDE